MAKRRRKRRRSGIGGCLIWLIVLLLIPAFLGRRFPEKSLPNPLERIRETTAFPELTVEINEVEGSFYYRQLNEEEQLVYRELLQIVQQMQEGVPVHGGEETDIEKIYRFLMYDRPELFWCDGASTYVTYSDHTEFTPSYTCTEEERQARQAQIDEAVSQCIAGLAADTSEYERIKYMFEYIVNTVEYDLGAPDNQNIYSSLVGKRSVCAGYSRAAQYLLGKIGIESTYVTGEIAGGGLHAWNLVKCGENWYQMDVTFGDPVFLQTEEGQQMPENNINYDYLCCTDAEIGRDHIPNDSVTYPACSSDDLNYYRLNGMYYETFDPYEILQAMNDSVYAGEPEFLCKFSDADVYSQASTQMIEELIPQAAQNLAYAYGLGRVSYSYINDEEHCKMTVLWNYE